MKNFSIVLLIILVVISGLYFVFQDANKTVYALKNGGGAEHVEENLWEINEYVDKYDEKTGQKYIIKDFDFRSSSIRYCSLIVDSSRIRIINYVHDEVGAIDAQLWIKNSEGVEFKYYYERGMIRGYESFSDTIWKNIYNHISDLYTELEKEEPLIFHFDCGSRGKNLKFNLHFDSKGFNSKFSQIF